MRMDEVSQQRAATVHERDSLRNWHRNVTAARQQSHQHAVEADRLRMSHVTDESVEVVAFPVSIH